MTKADPRTDAVHALLREHAIPVRDVRVCGFDDEIAVLEAQAGWLPRLAQLATEIKSLGFRYVTLDLAGLGAGDG